jgi:pyrroloquinoline-quinone synthase
MNLFARLDAARERWNALRHPFYRRWSEGGLERVELGHYAGQYRHAVRALADQTSACAGGAEPALRPALEEHVAEEDAHLALWDRFAAAFDAPADPPLDAGTAACVESWTAGADLLERLAVLHVVEAAQPAISATKLAGLVEHYGVPGDAPAAAYFVLHADRDHEHAAQSRALLTARAGERDEDRLVARAEAALAGNWALLDDVEARCPAPGS